ncbi:MAG TPA: hypothetical protein VN231_11615 [Allosphingosinicella sp.]|nr:hypothetical protein [Allosphingosinicella sp.]
MLRRFIPFALLAMTACARSEDASVVTDRNEMQAVERVRAPERDDEDIALGDWRETLQDENRALEFGPAGAPPLFSLRCDTRRSIFLQRHGTLPAGDLPMMLISIGSETRRLAVTDVGGAVPMLRASLAPSDTLLGTLTQSTTPIAIRIGDSPPLILPPSPAIGAFLNQCSSGAAQPPADEGAGGNSSAGSNEASPAAPASAER